MTLKKDGKTYQYMWDTPQQGLTVLAKIKKQVDNPDTNLEPEDMVTLVQMMFQIEGKQK